MISAETISHLVLVIHSGWGFTEISVCAVSAKLLDIVAVTRCAAANPALATIVAANSATPLDTNGSFYRGGRSIKCESTLVAMDTDEMTAQVMFATE